ncbi:hypothetical protein JKP88DRAFT_283841 [Tribonema minus]|uniref:Uncharacterized protein n=1 Tax=Tribonema minus TaxID=303371 RepID=A0A835YK99_9STRA|nr:hypothetical protein JKP88DRAFT_283841 [Tribonema minus]
MFQAKQDLDLSGGEVTERKRPEAVLLTRGQDIEGEAHALARLSVLYADVMCLREKAMLCSEKAMELGESLAPRDLTSVGWFNDALRVFDKCKRLGTAGTADTLSDEEKAAIKTDLKHATGSADALSDEEKAAIKTDLKVEIEELQRIAKDNCSANVHRIRRLIAHLYAKYPPRNSAHVMGPTEPDKLKRTLLTCVMHYHPDKQAKHKAIPAAEWTTISTNLKSFKHWLVLCSEAIYLLNFLHEHTYKGSV